MFLEKGGFSGKKNKVLLGYDLGDYFSQISFWGPDGEEPETISVVTGQQQYNFPTVLGKRLEVNQWLYGKEALRLAEDGKGILVERLLTLAKEGNPVVVGEDEFDPIALLALFMKRSLSLLSMEVSPDQIGAIMITVDQLDSRMVEVLTEAVAVMQLQVDRIYFQSHLESFFEYAVHQPKELLKGNVLLCDYEREALSIYRLECNMRTTPIVAYVEENHQDAFEKQDALLQEILEETCFERNVGTAYLIGEGFDGGWYENSLRFLCRGRRVFRGNNLYSKGACYGIREKVYGDGQRKYVFLGTDKLKSNLGMRIMRQGKESYFTLLDAGESWYEAEKECEFILESDNSFSLLVTPLTGGEPREIEMILNDMPKRPGRATRINMKVRMTSETMVQVTIEDLGFGELYPATNQKWQEEFEI